MQDKPSTTELPCLSFTHLFECKNELAVEPQTMDIVDMAIDRVVCQKSSFIEIGNFKIPKS
jgi:hypothetical protein